MSTVPISTQLMYVLNRWHMKANKQQKNLIAILKIHLPNKLGTKLASVKSSLAAVRLGEEGRS